MGELRTSITELAKQVAAAGKAGEAAAERFEAIDQRLDKVVDNAKGGLDVLWTYLVALFEKNGRNVDDHLQDRLSQHADTEITTYLKGIDAAVDNAARVVEEFTRAKQQSLPAEYDRIDGAIAAIRQNVEKKRSKLLQSKAYKAKLVTYGRALDELAGAIAQRRQAFADIQPVISVARLEEMRIKPTATIAEAKKQADTTYRRSLEDMRKARTKPGTWTPRKWRENGDLKAAFEQMKRWAGDADAMDQEVVNLDPNAVKPIKDVKIFHGQRLVATAPKAIFQGKRPMEVAGVTWQKGIDSLSLLQQPVRLEAEYASGGGTFKHDMKIHGIKGQTVKLT